MARLKLYFLVSFVLLKISLNCFLFEFLALLGMRCHFLRKCITVYSDSDALFVGAGQFLRRGCQDNVQKSQHMCRAIKQGMV